MLLLFSHPDHPQHFNENILPFSRFQIQIREINESKDKLTVELETANEKIAEQRNIIDQLSLQLAEREKTINEKEQQLAQTEKELKNEVNLRLWYLKICVCSTRV